MTKPVSHLTTVADQIRDASRRRGSQEPFRTTAPQLATGSTVPPVQALPGEVLLHLSITEPAVVTAAHDAQRAGVDLSVWVTQALLAGATALQASGAMVQRAELQAQIDRAVQGVQAAADGSVLRFEDSLRGLLDPSSGALGQASQAAVTRLAQGIDLILTGPEALLPLRVRTSVSESLAVVTGEWQRTVAGQAEQLRAFVETDRAQMREALTEALAEQGERLAGAIGQVQATLAVREQLEKASKPTPQAGGLAYEANAVNAVLRVAAAAGDRGEHVGLQIGLISASKVGDGMIEMSTLSPTRPPRLVVEAKLRDRRLSTKSWADLLEESRANRGAIVALGLTPAEQMPVPGHAICVISNCGVVVAFDPADHNTEQEERLRTAFLLLRLLAATLQRHTDHDASVLDVGVIRAQLDALMASLEPLNKISKSAVTARRSIDAISTAGSALQADLADRIAQLHLQLG